MDEAHIGLGILKKYLWEAGLKTSAVTQSKYQHLQVQQTCSPFF